MRAVLALLAGLLSSSALAAPPSSLEEDLGRTLTELAALGHKRAGTPAGVAAGDYVAQRFQAAGLQNVRYETFSWPMFQLQQSSLSVTIQGVPVPMAHDVFAYSGVGAVDAEIVYVGTGHATSYLGKNVTGKVVMVLRDPSYHRSSQYTQVVSHGGAAMLYVSKAPWNLIQIGTVSDAEGGLGPIPSVTVGQLDGMQIINAVTSGQTARAAISVAATVQPATGRNVVGEIPGTDPSGAYLLVGAHYDTWQIGSADNGTGVAAMLELAEWAVPRAPFTYGMVFVGFDAEETGLFGGYDYLRKHVIVGREPMLGFINLEIPGAGKGLKGLARTTASRVDEVLDAVGMSSLYAVVDMALVPQVFGGIIPTDIQGMYWYGLQGLSTACDTPWYHTVEDTPEKISLSFLAESVRRFEDALPLLHLEPASTFRQHDATVWRLQATQTFVAGSLVVDVVVTDEAGTPQPGAAVRLWVDVDDFTRVTQHSAISDASGGAQFTIAPAFLQMGQGSRWFHVTAGIDYPLAETIQRIHPPL